MKKKFLNSVVFMLVAVIFSSLILATGCGNDGGKTVIKVDGGSSSSYFTYNTTRSQDYDAELNPYPYKTLEDLANEWNAMPGHENYKVEINATSYGGGRETFLSLLNGRTGPDIIYYPTTTIAEDMNAGFFADLTEYLNQPNPYSEEGEPGSVKWSDVYADQEAFNRVVAPNGKYLYVPLEQLPICLIYNKTYVSDQEAPEYFDEFMELQDQLYEEYHASDEDFMPYHECYPWYDIAIETAVYSSKVDSLDVIIENGVVNAEEIARAYMNEPQQYSPEDDYSKEVMRLVTQLTKYFPKDFDNMDRFTKFYNGEIAMLCVTGGELRKIIDNVKFAIGLIGLPKVRGSESGTGDYFSKYEVIGNSRRGLSGYSTCWAVTNSAMDKGQEAVDMCADFLMYITAYEQNDRMINGIGYAIPLSGNTEDEKYKDLMELYEQDKADPTSFAWEAMCAKSTLTKGYYNSYRTFRTSKLAKNGGVWDENIDLSSLVSSFEGAINQLYTYNKWDKTKWPDFNG